MGMQEGMTMEAVMKLLQQYLQKEQQHWKPHRYSGKDEEITGEQRDTIVRWLAIINNYLRFTPETLFLSVNLLDEFLHSVRARLKYLKCIAISCFYLASKIVEEDELVPRIKDLIDISNCQCSVSEIMRMERVILNKLNWDLCRATSLDFLHGFHALLVLNCTGVLPDESLQSLRQLGPLLETKLQICLRQNSLLGLKPSTMALALLSLELEPWTRNWFVITIALQRLTKVENADLIRCREELCRAFSLCYAPQKEKLHKDYYHVAKPSKRKMEKTDIEDIYDSIKKLYGDDNPSNCTTGHPNALMDNSFSAVRAI